MAKLKAQKQQILSEYSDKIKSANAMYFVTPVALSGPDSVKFKMSMVSTDAVYSVVKNTIFIKAIEGSELNGSGEHAVVFVNGEDIATPAKSLNEFVKETKKMKVLGGYFAGKFISSDDVIAIADLPSREVQLGITLGTMMSVPTNFVRASANNIERFLRVLNAISETK
ncbi:50S ribosomal protein L10 [bacterium]|nr:MAG: 50S ribosomal protein L10 [bacterium]